MNQENEVTSEVNFATSVEGDPAAEAAMAADTPKVVIRGRGRPRKLVETVVEEVAPAEVATAEVAQVQPRAAEEQRPEGISELTWLEMQTGKRELEKYRAVPAAEPSPSQAVERDPMWVPNFNQSANPAG